MNLAKHPASTVQILGAEKALFRALKTKKDTPKYGLIYHASMIGQAAPKFKGKVRHRHGLCAPSSAHILHWLARVRMPTCPTNIPNPNLLRRFPVSSLPSVLCQSASMLSVPLSHTSHFASMPSDLLPHILFPNQFPYPYANLSIPYASPHHHVMQVIHPRRPSVSKTELKWRSGCDSSRASQVEQ